MKLNKLFYLLIAVCAIFTACGESTTSEEQPAKGYLTVIDEQVSFDFYGGKAEIYYVISDGDEGARPKAKTTAQWIKSIEMDEQTITFNVEPNTTESKRVASLTISFGQQSYDVFVNQEGAWKVDIEYTAQAINGQYNGTKYGDPNYFVILSTFGSYGEIWRGADTYYRLDMYSTTAAGEVVTLPNGVYVYDMYDMGDGGTFGRSYSWFLDSLSDGSFYESQFQDGVVIVTDNKLEAWLKLAKNGQVHHVVYEGALELGYIPMPTPDYYSNLTGDFTFNHTDGIIRLKNYGDEYGVGGNNWLVSMVLPGDKINGDYFSLDIITDDLDNSNDGIIGTYTCVPNEDSVGKNTFIAGDYLNQFSFSWYFDCIEDSFGTSFMAPLKGGTITIEAEGTGYLVTYDCTDDNGHKITGTYSCPVVEVYSK